MNILEKAAKIIQYIGPINEDSYSMYLRDGVLWCECWVNSYNGDMNGFQRRLATEKDIKLGQLEQLYWQKFENAEYNDKRQKAIDNFYKS